MTQRIKAAKLKLDYNLYPRHDVDRQHVGYLVDALACGQKLPPVIADRKSHRVVDGFHRTLAHLRHFGEADAEIDVDFRPFRNEAAILLEAGELNSHHGRSMDRHDRVHFAMLCGDLNIPLDDVASALHMGKDRLSELLDRRTASVKSGGSKKKVPLKRTIEHMADRRLTKGQEEANQKLGGMNQGFIFNQAILLLRENLVDTGNPHVVEKIRELATLAKRFLATLR